MAKLVKRYQARAWKKSVFFVCCLILFSTFNFFWSSDGSQTPAGGGLQASTGRHLLQTETTPAMTLNTLGCPVNETFIAVCEKSCDCDTDPLAYYPSDGFTCENRRSGAIAIHILITLYMFFGIAIAVDEYFVPALDVLTQVLGISKDVAGATFMAAGGSTPELFASFFGVFVAPDSGVGIGTVVGSAVFNVLFVIAAVALFSYKTLTLTWWPLFRDSVFYSVSLVLLALAFVDSQVDAWESGVMLGWYVLYCLFMKFSEPVEAWARRRTRAQIRFANLTYRTPVTFRSGALHVLLKEVDPMNKGTAPGSEGRFRRMAQIVLEDQRRQRLEAEGIDDPLVGAPERVSLRPPDTWPLRVGWLLLLPLRALLFITVPDVNRDGWRGRNLFFITFVMSIVWIGVYSYVLVWGVTAIGDTINVPTFIMAITILAAGTSVPDLLSSVIVARQGQGDMAVSSSLGSNLFDTSVGLPLPWLVYSLANSGAAIPVNSRGLLLNVLTLLAMLIAVIVTVAASGWRLSKTLGLIMFILYFVFIAEAFIVEYAIPKQPVLSQLIASYCRGEGGE